MQVCFHVFKETEKLLQDTFSNVCGQHLRADLFLITADPESAVISDEFMSAHYDLAT